jgi:hypothetical protein
MQNEEEVDPSENGNEFFVHHSSFIIHHLPAHAGESGVRA